MAQDTNRDRVVATIRALGPLSDELCLVGGCAVGLLITDEAASPVRVTIDVDLMPLAEEVLGFGNRWYRRAFDARVRRALTPDVALFHVDAPHLVAMKLDAFASRGAGFHAASKDLEDVVRIVDGREELLDEVARSGADLRSFLAEGIRGILDDRHFLEAMPDYFDDGDLRTGVVHARLEELASLH